MTAARYVEAQQLKKNKPAVSLRADLLHTAEHYLTVLEALPLVGPLVAKSKLKAKASGALVLRGATVAAQQVNGTVKQPIEAMGSALSGGVPNLRLRPAPAPAPAGGSGAQDAAAASDAPAAEKKAAWGGGGGGGGWGGRIPTAGSSARYEQGAESGGKRQPGSHLGARSSGSGDAKVYALDTLDGTLDDSHVLDAEDAV